MNIFRKILSFMILIGVVALLVLSFIMPDNISIDIYKIALIIIALFIVIFPYLKKLKAGKDGIELELVSFLEETSPNEIAQIEKLEIEEAKKSKRISIVELRNKAKEKLWKGQGNIKTFEKIVVNNEEISEKAIVYDLYNEDEKTLVKIIQSNSFSSICDKLYVLINRFRLYKMSNSDAKFVIMLASEDNAAKYEIEHKINEVFAPAKSKGYFEICNL